MGFYIAKGSLLDQKVDAIVVPSQPSLKLEGIVGSQIKEACDEKLLLELEQYKNINIGECAIANSYHKNFKKVILVANPRWEKDYDQKEKNRAEYNLSQSYLSCMEKAQDFGLNSVAFPLLSVGAYNFPKRKAIEIAIETITNFVEYEDLDVLLVIYSESIFKTYKELFTNYKVIGGTLKKDTKDYLQIMKMEQKRFYWYFKNIEETLEEGTDSKTFAERINYYIASKGLTKTDCYSGIVSKNMFNNYLNGNVKPGKYTIVSLGINMGLDIYEINDLLKPFGEFLDNRLDVDAVIVQKMISRSSIEEINDTLIDYGFYPVLKQVKDE